MRSWPWRWHYDDYDLTAWLKPGENTLFVYALHWQEGNFQYLPGPAGLLASLELEHENIVTDSSWKALADAATAPVTPRISIQQAFEEQFDARLQRWDFLGSGSDAWDNALELREAEDGFHRNFTVRGIPQLTAEPVLPARVVEASVVRPPRYVFAFNLRNIALPGDKTANAFSVNGAFATWVYVPFNCTVKIAYEHMMLLAGATLDGRAVSGNEFCLAAGWHALRFRLHCPEFMQHQFALALDGPEGLVFDCRKGGGAQWSFVGPFDDDFCEWRGAQQIISHALPKAPDATKEAADAFMRMEWDPPREAVLELSGEQAPPVDVFALTYAPEALGSAALENGEALLSGCGWARIPAGQGDVRLLLDFGRMLVGFTQFEAVACEGAVLDFNGFEFIQPDGRRNYAEGMNLSFRYMCREGRQSFTSFVRRGYRYLYITVRNLRSDLVIRGVKTVFSTYPQRNAGSFSCSDAALDRIWKIGANTLRCCAEDTWTDCPTYEQTGWVGDARNEALIDWAINGDSRLWRSFLRLAGDSLERSPIVEGHVPSSWQNILSTWTALWMRSAAEYWAYTGDRAGSIELLGYLERNAAGIRQHMNGDGLFDLLAWNMFDWAEMDTPSDAVVTHLNCQLSQALRETADMAEQLGRPDLAEGWRAMAETMARAVNDLMWNEEKQAYTDCLRGREQSAVFSQQTQTAALLSGVAKDERVERCREIMHDAPEGFVRAGSPFYEFFLLEALQREGRDKDFLDTIRRDWGFMADTGCDTFWEMWTFTDGMGRLTRSHCHGWSAAPTFFLSAWVLGVTPAAPGFKSVRIAPHPGDLRWCRGVMPTPMGPVAVQWESREDGRFSLTATVPEGMEVIVELPEEGDYSILSDCLLMGQSESNTRKSIS